MALLLTNPFTTTTSILIILLSIYTILPTTYAQTTSPSTGCNNPPTEKGQLGYNLQPGKYQNFKRKLPGTQRRTHRLHLPNNYASTNNSPPPLILYFHGWGGDAFDCQQCRTDALTKGFVVVTMTGYGSSWKHGGSSDNSDNGPSCDTSLTDGYCQDYKNLGCDCSKEDTSCYWTTCYDSVQQVVSVLEEVEQTICYDTKKIWAVGCSNGGMFTFELAKDPRMADTLKGIVPIVGLPHYGYSEGPLNGNIRMMGMWGDNDKVVPPISNTDNPDKTMGNEAWYYTSSNKVLKDWTLAKGCTGEGQDPIDENIDWGIGKYSNELDCTQGCTEDTYDKNNRVVGCIFQGNHWCDGNFIWDPIFNFMLANNNNNNDDCQDSILSFVLNKKKNKTCTWVAKNPGKRCVRAKGAVATHCPKTCNACPNCVDASRKFQLENGNMKTCTWVSNWKTEERCANNGVDWTCRETCGKC